MDLLSCPFCGSSAVKEIRTYKHSYDRSTPVCWVQCSKCFCRTDEYPDYDYKKAYKAWNKRPKTIPGM